jgi:acyl-CoA synthetase (AMP-forming)/AMP-acid ligase II
MTSNALPPAARKAGSVGRAHGSVAVSVRSDATGLPVPPLTEGEICVSGPNVTAGYLNNPTANASSFWPLTAAEQAQRKALSGAALSAEGDVQWRWFRTGDQGYADSEGYVYITGRIKELINRGGEKIAPLEVSGWGGRSTGETVLCLI